MILFSVVLFVVLPSSGVSIAGWVAASVIFIQPAERIFLEDEASCFAILAKLQVVEFQRVPVEQVRVWYLPSICPSSAFSKFAIISWSLPAGIFDPFFCITCVGISRMVCNLKKHILRC
jgi:hypothetical protein